MRREETVDYHIKAAWHAIARMYSQQASKYKVTMSMGFVLLNINIEKGTPATKIAPLMGLEARSLTRLLKSMEEKGLIYRLADEKDRRSVRICLTEEGKRKRAEARETVINFNTSVRQFISEEQLQNFFNVIRAINQVTEKPKAEAVYRKS